MILFMYYLISPFYSFKHNLTFLFTFIDRDQFQLGTLSHFINAKAAGYKELPDFPTTVPDSTVRSVPGFSDDSPKGREDGARSKGSPKKGKKAKSFYSSASEVEEEEKTDSEEEEEDESSTEEDESESEESSSEDREEESSSSDGEEEEEESSEEESTDESSSSSSSSDEEEESEEEIIQTKVTKKKEPSKPSKSLRNGHPAEEPKPTSNLDLLLGLDEVPPSIDTPMLTPSLGGLLSPMDPSSAKPSPTEEEAVPIVTPGHSVEVLNKISGNGLSVRALFTRSPHIYCPNMTAIQLTFTNTKSQLIKSISMEGGAPTFHSFGSIANVASEGEVHATLGIDYQDSSQPQSFTLSVDDQTHKITITPLIGELIKPKYMDEPNFLKHQVSLFLLIQFRKLQ